MDQDCVFSPPTALLPLVISKSLMVPLVFQPFFFFFDEPPVSICPPSLLLPLCGCASRQTPLGVYVPFRQEGANTPALTLPFLPGSRRIPFANPLPPSSSFVFFLYRHYVQKVHSGPARVFPLVLSFSLLLFTFTALFPSSSLNHAGSFRVLQTSPTECPPFFFSVVIRPREIFSPPLVLPKLQPTMRVLFSLDNFFPSHVSSAAFRGRAMGPTPTRRSTLKTAPFSVGG